MTLSPSNVAEDRVVGIGDNKAPIAALISAEEGDFAQVTTAFLAEEYAKQRTITQSLLDEATALMRGADGKLKKIDDDDTKAKVVSLIKRMRDHAKALTAFHSKEKQAYLRGGQGVDQFFFGDIDKLSRRDKKNTSTDGIARPWHTSAHVTKCVLLEARASQPRGQGKHNSAHWMTLILNPNSQRAWRYVY